jgi:hypothetical protein
MGPRSIRTLSMTPASSSSWMAWRRWPWRTETSLAKDGSCRHSRRPPRSLPGSHAASLPKGNDGRHARRAQTRWPGSSTPGPNGLVPSGLMYQTLHR